MNQEVRINAPTALRHMVGLCAYRGVYLGWTIADIARLFLPPLRERQCKLYFEGGTCSAFVTWALLSCELSSRLRLCFEDPPPDQWRSGDQLWIIDMVGPGKAFEVARDLKQTIFAERVEPAYALRRDATGAVRKIARWDPRNG